MSDYSTSVDQLLDIARRHLGMDVAWVSKFSADTQVFESVAEAVPGLGPVPGSTEPLQGSYCVRVLDGRLPAVVPDARADPRTRDLAVTDSLHIGAYVGVPLQVRSGETRGMLCCVARSGQRLVSEEDLRLLELVGEVIGLLLAAEKDPDEVSLEQADRRRIRDVIAGESTEHALTTVLQPIVDLKTGALWGFEALARFGPDGGNPSRWFGEAERMGLRCQLETAAARSALARRDELPPGVKLAVNVSPDVLAQGYLDADLDGTDLRDVVVEVTENAAVADYAALKKVLEPHRARGLEIAVDDAGAGYASFLHIVRLRPEVIKVDLTLIRDIDSDPVRQSLVVSLVSFAAMTGSVLVAEGVETRDELDMLASLGVPSAQGFLLGRPEPDLPALDLPLLPGVRPVPDLPRQPAVTPAPVVTELSARNQR